MTPEESKSPTHLKDLVGLLDSVTIVRKLRELEERTQLAEAGDRALREALDGVLSAWEVFHANLPDGEYKGLGELRLIIGILKRRAALDKRST